MPTSSKKRTRIDPDGTPHDALSIEFTNGALAQLEELRQFLKVDDVTDVVKYGISFIQKLKESGDTHDKI